MSKIEEYISTAEAARITGLKRGQIANLCATGILTASRIGRAWLVLKSSAEAYKRRAPGVKPKKGAQDERR